MVEKAPLLRRITASALMSFAAASAAAAELVVKVSGIERSVGQVGCALFSSAGGFPMDNAAARQIWQPADQRGVVCNFNDVPSGSYAVSASHDLNGNKKVDTNLVGIPTEPWGVSRNARPWLRAPRWEEASFDLAEGRDLAIEIRVAK